MSQRTKNQTKTDDYYYKGRIASQKKALEKIVSNHEYRLLEKYDTVMINESLSDATRCKQFEIILSLTRLLSKKSWLSLTQDDIDTLVSNVMRTYSDDGKETNTTYDHKKILKIFFRWLKLGSRSFRDVGNPPELQIPIALAETIGGIFLIVGFMTRITGVIFSIILLDAIFHIRWENGFLISQGGWDYDLALLAMTLFVIVNGAGKLSLVAKLKIPKIPH